MYIDGIHTYVYMGRSHGSSDSTFVAAVREDWLNLIIGERNGLKKHWKIFAFD